MGCHLNIWVKGRSEVGPLIGNMFNVYPKYVCGLIAKIIEKYYCMYEAPGRGEVRDNRRWIKKIREIWKDRGETGVGE